MSGEFSRGSPEDVEILGGTNQLPNLFSFTFVAIQNSRAAEGDWLKNSREIHAVVYHSLGGTVYSVNRSIWSFGVAHYSGYSPTCLGKLFP